MSIEEDIEKTQQFFNSEDVMDGDTLIVSLDKSENGEPVFVLLSIYGDKIKFILRYFKGIRHYTDVSRTSNAKEKNRYLCKFFKRYRNIVRKNDPFYLSEYCYRNGTKTLSYYRVRDMLSSLGKKTIFIVDDNHIKDVREAIKEWYQTNKFQAEILNSSSNFYHTNIYNPWNRGIIKKVVILREGFLHRSLTPLGKVYENLYLFLTIADNWANYLRRRPKC